MWSLICINLTNLQYCNASKALLYIHLMIILIFSTYFLFIFIYLVNIQSDNTNSTTSCHRPYLPPSIPQISCQIVHLVFLPNSLRKTLFWESSNKKITYRFFRVAIRNIYNLFCPSNPFNIHRSATSTFRPRHIRSSRSSRPYPSSAQLAFVRCV